MGLTKRDMKEYRKRNLADLRRNEKKYRDNNPQKIMEKCVKQIELQLGIIKYFLNRGITPSKPKTNNDK